MTAREGTPIEQWGTRLSDALRLALRNGNMTEAAATVERGDGQAQNLAKEYALMYRGLAFTVTAILDQLAAYVEQDDAPAEAASRLAEISRRLQNGIGSPGAGGDAGSDADAAASVIAAAKQALKLYIPAFDRAQAEAAAAILAAIEAGDETRALTLLDEKDDAYLTLHDPMVRFMADSFGWVLETRGADELLAFHLATAEAQRGGFEKWERMSAREFAWTSAFLLKLHMGSVQASETAESFTITQSPCGSGGRLQLEGAYEGEDGLPIVESAGPLTFGSARLPVYCSHCAIWNGLATLRWFGHAQWVFDAPARADGGCSLRIYKDPADIPPDYVEMLLGSGDDAARPN